MMDIEQELKRLSKVRDFRKLLSESLVVTSRLFKDLLKRQTGINDFNPFAKGSMSFDDYSYKYFNDLILNPKALLALNLDT